MQTNYIYNIDELINQIPEDIVNRIIPYTYSVQNKELLYDISHFINSKNYIINVYCNVLVFNHPKPMEWLEHDLYVYINNNMFYSDETYIGIYEIFKRNYCLRNKSTGELSEIVRKMNEKIINKSIINFDDKEYDYILIKSVNRMWSHLTIDERQGFIKMCNQKVYLYSEAN